ncbi:hypothetical protein CH252_20340, partial [Rhodococcus sp. 06-1477-1B]
MSDTPDATGGDVAPDAPVPTPDASASSAPEAVGRDAIRARGPRAAARCAMQDLPARTTPT